MPSATENAIKNLIPIKTEQDTPVRLDRVSPSTSGYENYGKKDFLIMFKEFEPAFNQNENYCNTLFDIYLTLARQMFIPSRYFELTTRVWGLYIAHNLQVSLNAAKNIDNVANLNSSIQTVSRKGNIGGNKHEFRSTINEFYNSYAQTQYGIALYPLIKNIEKLNMIGVY